MDRREFLRAAGVAAGAVTLGGGVLLGDDDARAVVRADVRSGSGGDSILDHPAKESPIDTVVVLMVENRSFDHYYGWLGSDEGYLDAGRRRYGKDFHIDGRVKGAYRKPGSPDRVHTTALVGNPNEPNPWRGCNHPPPGHTWENGRAQLRHGFLGEGTGNDEFATSYFLGADLPFHAELASRWTVFDRYFPSLLASTFPNRQYLHTAQSEGNKEDPTQLDIGIFGGRTIWDQLERARVPARSYYTDLPVLLLFGDKYSDRVASTDRFFEDCEHGTLPRVAFVDPGFGGDERTDDHPQGDVRLGQRFIREIFRAFRSSPHWEHGVFILVYDEWGGFFDHVRPPRLPDARASKVLKNDFGQAGFRVPAAMASPYGLYGGVDHRVYDHTSVLRFLEWRFLGAPAEGPKGGSGSWWLTTRDRHAHNIGATLSTRRGDVDWQSELPVSAASPACAPGQAAVGTDPFTYSAALTEALIADYPGPALTPWLDNEKETPLPAEPKALTPASAPPTPSTTGPAKR